MTTNFFNLGRDFRPDAFSAASVPSSFGSPVFEADTLGTAFSAAKPALEGSPTKPGSESPFANAWFGGALLLEGVNNAIRSYRGLDPVPGMAGTMIQQYMAQQRDDERLNKLLDRLSPKGAQDALMAAVAPAVLKTDNPLRGIGDLAYGRA
jgi:hypothetical protein